MATESKPNWKRIWFYWKRAFVKTRKETEISSLIWEAIVCGVIPVLLGVRAGIIGRDEIKELSFLALVGAACGVVIPFTMRLLFVTPEKLYREIEKRLANGDEEQPTAKTPTLGLAILGSLCISLALAFDIQNSKYRDLKATFDSPPATNQMAVLRPVLKRLPDINIPNPSISTVAPPTNAPPQLSFITNSPSNTNLLDAVLDKYAAEHERKAAEARKQAESRAEEDWTNNLPDRNYVLESLYNILHIEADRNREHVVKSDILHCLPNTITLDSDDADSESLVAKIWLEKRTNVCFEVSIIHCHAEPIKRLRIRGSCVEVQFFANNFDANAPIGYINKIPPQIKDAEGPIQLPRGHSHDVIDETMSLLVEAQIRYSNPTNKP